MSRKPMKHGDATVSVPEDQVIVYQTCESCQQSMPLDQFDKRGRWRPGQPPADSVCKHCRKIQIVETRKYVRRNSAKIDEMQLNLVAALAAEPTDEFDDEVPNVGTMIQTLLRPFGGMKGLSLQVASSFLSSEPNSPNRQKIQAMLVKLGVEGSKLGYAKKPVELLSDEDLEKYLEERERRHLSHAQNDEEETASDGA